MAKKKLKFLNDDTVGFCDVNTGICTVPDPNDTPGTLDEQQKLASDERTRKKNDEPPSKS